MSVIKTVDGGVWLVEETTRLRELKIRDGAALKAPEGKCLTLSLDGVETDPTPGTYCGDVVITISDPIPVDFASFGPGTSHIFRAGIYMDGGKYVPEKSVSAVVRGGSVSDNVIRDVTVTSHGESFNNIYMEGDGDYLVENVRLDGVGNGGNDFCGYGAVLATNGNGTLTVNDSHITSRGAARNAIFAGGKSTLIVNNSTISAMDGRLPGDYEDSIMPGDMKCVPWMLGLRGNCRATNLADYGTAYYNNCKLTSAGWGVMSTDAVDVCRLHLKDSLIEITGPSGYGAFSIGDCHDYFDNCTVNVPDYALIAANENACGTFTNGTVVNSKRFGVMFFNNEGTVTVEKGATFNTEKATFLIKGCTPVINADDAVLNPKSGVILQLFNTDDPSNPGGYYCDPTEEDVPMEGRDLTKAAPGQDVIASFSNMTINGSFYNATTVVKGDTGPAFEMPMPPGADPNGPPPGEGPGGPGGSIVQNLELTFVSTEVTGVITGSKAVHNVPRVDKFNCEELGEVNNTPQEIVNNGVIVNLDKNSVWTVTGTSYLSALTIAEGAVIAAPAGKAVSMMVDGASVAPNAGAYTGKIVVTVGK